jgi:hypothetical protein
MLINDGDITVKMWRHVYGNVMHTLDLMVTTRVWRGNVGWLQASFTVSGVTASSPPLQSEVHQIARLQ